MPRPAHRHRTLLAYPANCIGLKEFVATLRHKYFPEWISYRSNSLYFEPNFGIFRSPTIDLDTFINHVEPRVSTYRTFRFGLKCVTAQPSDNAGFLLQLVSDEGFQHFFKLSLLLDDGNLTNYYPYFYIPGVTVGWHSSMDEINEICRQINKSNFEYTGKIDTLTVIDVTQDHESYIAHKIYLQ
ncbi:MAG: hypothetical protein AAF846_06115 [Chloroflexota bacterium]